MNETDPFADDLNPVTVDDIAAHWLVIHDRGPSEAEAEAFRIWHDADENHAQAWAHACAIWSSFDETPDPLLLAMQHSARAMRPAAWKFRPLWWSAAAAVVASVGVAGWLNGGLRLPLDSPVQVAVRAPQIYSASQSRLDVTLQDGSHMLLDAGSKVAVAQTAARRDVALLAGQAFFQVAHDRERPFVVSAASHQVTATGTAFAVSLSSSGISVVLAQGRVEVTGLGSTRPPVAMSPGQKLEIDDHGAETLKEVDVEATLAWREGFLELHDVPIREALAEMNRSSASKVTIGDSRTGDLRVSGRFRSGDAPRFAARLAEIYPVRVRHLSSGKLEIVSTERPAR
jgi:transmembrane sensor